MLETPQDSASDLLHSRSLAYLTHVIRNICLLQPEVDGQRELDAYGLAVLLAG